MIKNKVNNGPDFICIGAQRSGTTWLYCRLMEHPDFDMLFKKEIHYFDRSNIYESVDTLRQTKLIKRLFDTDWVSNATTDCLKSLKGNNYTNLSRKLRWYFSNYNDKWYLSLFKDLNGISGDITPAYSILHENDIKRISELLPNLKIIFLIRNPIVRAWSSYRLNYIKKGRALNNTDDIIDYLERPNTVLKSDYMKVLNRYKKHFASNQILIGFYDAIIDQPNNLISDIVKFLGGNATLVNQSCKLYTVNNQSPQTPMPLDIYKHLKSQYESSIYELAECFNGYCANWKESLSNPRYHGKIQYPTIIV